MKDQKELLFLSAKRAAPFCIIQIKVMQEFCYVEGKTDFLDDKSRPSPGHILKSEIKQWGISRGNPTNRAQDPVKNFVKNRN